MNKYLEDLIETLQYNSAYDILVAFQNGNIVMNYSKIKIDFLQESDILYIKNSNTDSLVCRIDFNNCKKIVTNETDKYIEKHIFISQNQNVIISVLAKLIDFANTNNTIQARIRCYK